MFSYTVAFNDQAGYQLLGQSFKLQVSGRYRPQKCWVGPIRKPQLDFLNDTVVGTGRPQSVSGRVRRPEDSSGLAICERRLVNKQQCR